jgi:hypothetical protein
MKTGFKKQKPRTHLSFRDSTFVVYHLNSNFSATDRQTSVRRQWHFPYPRNRIGVNAFLSQWFYLIMAAMVFKMYFTAWMW